jgi:hypothetical protein
MNVTGALRIRVTAAHTNCKPLNAKPANARSSDPPMETVYRRERWAGVEKNAASFAARLDS